MRIAQGMKSSVLFAALLLIGGLSAPLAQAVEPAATPAVGAAPAHEHQNFEAHMKSMADSLKLTKDQTPLWDKVVQTMDDNHDAMKKYSDAHHVKGQAMTATDRMKYKQVMTQMHADSMAKFNAVFEPFYNSLTPEQKKKADAALAHKPHAHKDHAGNASHEAPTPAH